MAKFRVYLLPANIACFECGRWMVTGEFAPGCTLTATCHTSGCTAKGVDLEVEIPFQEIDA